MPEPTIVTTLHCPKCGGSGLTVMAPLRDPRVLLRCPRCLRSWWSPTLDDPIRPSELREGVEPATRDEIRRAGWDHLVAEPTTD